MKIDVPLKEHIKKQIVIDLNDCDIDRIIIFGSFVYSDSPNDLDIAVFLRGGGDYFDIAMDLRARLRNINKIIPLDIIPVSPQVQENHFLNEINRGEVIYERSS